MSALRIFPFFLYISGLCERMELLRKCLKTMNIEIDDRRCDLFEKYYDLLIEWNSRFNMTAFTKKDEVIIKHFADSVALLAYQDISGKRILDVGSGAGFPGIPLKIMCPDCSIVLLDSLNKRISFLDEVISELGLSDITAVHGRAEDLAYDDEYREIYIPNKEILDEFNTCKKVKNSQEEILSH